MQYVCNIYVYMYIYPSLFLKEFEYVYLICILIKLTNLFYSGDGSIQKSAGECNS